MANKKKEKIKIETSLEKLRSVINNLENKIEADSYDDHYPTNSYDPCVTLTQEENGDLSIFAWIEFGTKVDIEVTSD